MAIQLQEVSKSFPRPSVVLEDVSLTVDYGEVFGLIGPNGAGKSTLVNITLGLITPSSGTVTLDGSNPHREPETARASVGFVPDDYDLYGEMTASSHLKFISGIRSSTCDRGALLKRVGLATSGETRVREFSSGMRQRLTIAMALAGETDILILDEPTMGLDPGGVNLLKDIISAERKSGMAVLIVSHSLLFVEEICGRVGILQDGRLQEKPATAVAFEQADWYGDDTVPDT